MEIAVIIVSSQPYEDKNREKTEMIEMITLEIEKQKKSRKKERKKEEA